MDPSVVAMVAQRDERSDDEARQYVADTLRLVAAAQAKRDAADGEPAPLLAESRAKHLRRTALARVWLRDDFERKHGPDAIPRDDPLLVRARTSRSNIHPEIHVICQVVAVPKGKKLAPDELIERAKPPAWREEARSLFEPVARRLVRYVPEDDKDACGLMARLLPKMGPESEAVDLQFQSGGFDLKACRVEGPDGSCQERRFVDEWTSKVAEADGPGFLEPFESPFGFHLVYVKQIEQQRTLQDPDAEAYLRGLVHRQWQAQAFERYLDRLQKKRSVKLAPVQPGSEEAGGS